MVSSGHRPILALVSVLAVAAALVLFWASSDTRPAQALDNFDISYNIKNCNALSDSAGLPWAGLGMAGVDATGPYGVGPANDIADCLENPAIETLTVDTVTDTTTTLCLPGRVNYVDCPASAFAPNLGARNFSTVVNYIPNGYQINGRMAADGFGADVPYGALAGAGDNTVNLTAALNSIDCNGTFPVPFLFYNIALPNVGTPGAPSSMANPDPRTSTNIVQSRDEGKKDRFGAWSSYPGPFPADDPADNIVDSVAPFDVAEPTSLPIAQYPKFLLDLYDPDYIPGIGDNADAGTDANNLPPLVPIAVYGGLSIPTGASTDWVPLYFVQFAPGQLAASGGTWVAPHPFSKAVAALGSPNFAVLNDPTAVKSSVSTILDFCGMVLSKIMLLGTVGGTTRFKTPVAAGTYSYQNWVSSLRDNDNDGRENGFDTCPYSVDGPPWNSDGDGLYDSCDILGLGTLGPAAADAGDIDTDGFDNRGDNCPRVMNGLAPVDPGNNGQADAELTIVIYGAAAPDGGPKTDSIGDLCETNTIWRDVFVNKAVPATTVDDLHLVFDAGKLIKRVLSITGGTAPDTWDWQINKPVHALNTASDCAHAADNTVDITGTGGTTVLANQRLTVILETCASQTALSVTAQWTLGGVNKGSSFVVVNDNISNPIVANGDFQVRAIATAKCIGGVDADRDGYCAGDKDAGSDAAGLCSDNLDNDSDTKVNDGCPASGPAETVCAEAVGFAKDDDGDGVLNDGCPVVGFREAGDNQVKHGAWASPLTGAANGDTDADTIGVKGDWQETFMGTDGAKRCAADTTPNNESGADRWGFDFNDDRQAGLGDVLSYIPVYLTVGNPRWDQNQDGAVGLADVLAFIPVYLSSCVP